MIAYLLCKECRQCIVIGKWVADTVGVGKGFDGGGLIASELGEKVLVFLSRHVNHDVSVLSDVFMEGLEDFDSYRRVDIECGDMSANARIMRRFLGSPRAKKPEEGERD